MKEKLIEYKKAGMIPKEAIFDEMEEYLKPEKPVNKLLEDPV